MTGQLNKLERAVCHYCGKIINCHKKQRRYVLHDGRNKPIWDLPMVAVSCEVNNIIKCDCSKPTNVRSYDSVPALKRALEQCGQIGQPGNYAGYQVGRCAEPHAAKLCLISAPHARLNDLCFSTARVIATREIMPYCGNCQHTFPQLEDTAAIQPDR